MTQPTPADPSAGTLTLPPGVALADPWLRLGSFVLELLLVLVTLGIGWLVWAAMLADNGQTPAKKLLGLRVIDASTLRPTGFARMLFLRGFVGEIVARFAIVFTLGVLAFMPFWDRNRQNIWDKVSGTYVVTDPNDAWQTRADLRGSPPPPPPPPPG